MRTTSVENERVAMLRAIPRLDQDPQALLKNWRAPLIPQFNQGVELPHPSFTAAGP